MRKSATKASKTKRWSARVTKHSDALDLQPKGFRSNNSRQVALSTKIVVLLLPSIAMAFTPPDEKAIHNAIGDLNALPAVLQTHVCAKQKQF
jgi:hypothetical protein